MNPYEIAESRPKIKTWKGGQDPRYVQDKLDGYRVTICKDGGGSVIAVGRKPNIDLWHELQNHAEIALRVAELPCNTVIDGELYAPGRYATDVPTLINEGEGLNLGVFAIPVLEKKYLTWKNLDYIQEIAERFDLEFTRWRFYAGETELELLESLPASQEGYVLKIFNYDDWWKVKPFKTVDCIVTGVKEGEGKYRGLLGAVEVSVYTEAMNLIHIADVGSGFKDSDRQDQEVIGRVAEVRYDSIGAGGKLRFPRFIRWRDDKPETECIFSQFK